MPVRAGGSGGVLAGSRRWPGPHAAVRRRYMAGAGALRTLRMVMVVVIAMCNVSGITGNVIRSKDAAPDDSPALQAGPSQVPSRRAETRPMAGRRSRIPAWSSAADTRQERSTGLFRPSEPKLLTSHGYTLVINSNTFAVEATNASDPKDGIFVTSGHLIQGDVANLIGPNAPKVGNLSMTIRSEETQRYVCMNATGHLYSSLEQYPECEFKEGIGHQFYSTFCSMAHPNASLPGVKRRWLGREWCIGISKRGRVLPGYRSNKNDSTSHFTKRQETDNPECRFVEDVLESGYSTFCSVNHTVPVRVGNHTEQRPMCVGIGHQADGSVQGVGAVLLGSQVNKLHPHAHFTKRTVLTGEPKLCFKFSEEGTVETVTQCPQEGLETSTTATTPTTSPTTTASTTRRTTTRDPYYFLMDFLLID